MTNTKHIIRIVVVGAVSTGKSTLINSIFTNKYSDTKIKRTTMIPQVYLETDEEINLVDANIINSRNTTINENILNNVVPLTKENCVEMTHLVPQIKDILELPNNVFLEIYDLPGLDDSQQEAIYFDYLKDNFEKFDLVIFNIDINEALNTSGSTRILNEIITNVENSKHKKYLLVTVNKCDNMNIDNNNELELDDEEQQEMYEQIINTLEKKIKFTQDKLEMKITKISALDSYIYRMLYKNPDVELDAKDLDKFGINELGKTKWKKMTCEEKKIFIKNTINDNYIDNLNTSGFNNIKYNLNTLLSYGNQYYLHYDRLMTEIENLIEVILDINVNEKDIKNNSHIVEIIHIINTLYKKYITLNNIYNNKLNFNVKFMTFKIKNNLCNILDIIIIKYFNTCESFLEKNYDSVMYITNIELIDDMFNLVNKKLYKHKLKDIVDKKLCDLSRLMNDKIILMSQKSNSDFYNNNFNIIQNWISRFYENEFYYDREDDYDHILIDTIFDNIMLYTHKVLKNTEIPDKSPICSLINNIMTLTQSPTILESIKKFYQKWLCKKYIDSEAGKASNTKINNIHSNTFKHLNIIYKNDDLFRNNRACSTILYYTNLIHYQECSKLYEKYKDNEFMSIYILNNEINKNKSHYLYNSYPGNDEDIIHALPLSKKIFDLRYSDFIKNKSYLIEEVEYYFENF